MKLHTRTQKARGPFLVALALALALVALALPATPTLADSCPNAAERFGVSANLPDCRAYELVTPPVKEDNSNLFNVYGFADGEHVFTNGIAPFPGAANGGGAPVLFSRTASGWVAKDISPAQGPGESDTFQTGDYGDSLFPVAFANDFSTAFVDTTFASDPRDQNLNHDVYGMDVSSGADALESLPDTGPMTASLYNPPGAFAGVRPGSYLTGASADGSRVFFTTAVSLPTAPGTPAEQQPVGNELFERHEGHTYLVGVLPDGSVPSCGAEAGEGGGNGVNYVEHYIYGAISSDGSNVVFATPSEHFPGETPGCQGEAPKEALYLRESNGTPQARTVTLPGTFYLGRSSNGSTIFSGGGPGGDAGGAPLYEYDVASEQSTKIGTGNLLAYSADGSVVYYLSHPAELDYGGSEQQLMVYDDGVTRAIPNAGPGYAGQSFHSNQVSLLGVAAEENLPVATPDGSKLLFLDRANLTSYDSEGPLCTTLNQGRGRSYLTQNCDEAYVYDLASGSFTCVSCNPDGTPPTGQTELFIPPGFTNQTPQTTFSLTEDGSRAFFETENALVPQDTNGQMDVYEWENGHVYLISSGQGSQGSRLDGVSSNGDDAIIQTSDELLPQDVESSTQIYDARVGGGFPYTTPVYGCDNGQCQGPQTPAPVFAPPASATFVGVGNPAFLQEAGAAPKPKAKRAKAKRRSTKHRSKKKGRPKGKKRNRDGKGKK